MSLAEISTQHAALKLIIVFLLFFLVQWIFLLNTPGMGRSSRRQTFSSHSSQKTRTTTTTTKKKKKKKKKNDFCVLISADNIFGCTVDSRYLDLAYLK